jgi:hypothetical protein
MIQIASALPDQPPAAPHSFDVKSKTGHVGAHLAWPEKRATVYTLSGAHKKELWGIDGWSPVAFVTDKGPTLALGNPANNLLPLTANEDTVVVTFYRDGSAVREVRLGEVISLSAARRTEKFLSWGVHYGFDAEGRYLIQAEDGRTVTLDPAGR